MNPLISKSLDGQHRCHSCRRWLAKDEDPRQHAHDRHRVGPDFLAFDDRGDCYDLRGMDLPKILRGSGAI